jgi:hypothetical protein
VLGCIGHLLPSQLLSDGRVQMILQSSSTKGKSRAEVLSSAEGGACSEILELLAAGHLHGVADREAGGGVLVLGMHLGELLTVESGRAVGWTHGHHLEGVGDPEGLGLVSLDN